MRFKSLLRGQAPKYRKMVAQDKRFLRTVMSNARISRTVCA